MSARGRAIAATWSLTVALGLAFPLAAAAADTVDAVTTPGSGELTVCRNWVIYKACDAHKVSLPEQIAVGDEIELSYGSNPKETSFRVGRIEREGETCTLFRRTPGSGADKIDVGSCRPAARTPAIGR